MKTKYKLICMSFDGEYITEARSNDTNELWNIAMNLGSKWFFYPFHFVCTNKKINQSYAPVSWFEGRNITTVQKWFKEASEKQQAKDLDPDDFLYFIDATANVIDYKKD